MNAVISGGTKGIGKAIIDLLSSKGVNIAVCSRNEADLATLKSELLAKNSELNVLTSVTDMSIKEEVLAFGELINKEWEAVDILVNNAGLFIPGELAKEEDGALEQMINTNLYSAYHLTRTLLPKFLSQRSGTIFNMCSIASKIAYPNGGSYSISKFALLGFSKVLREELKDQGIRVTSILPGATWSNSWAGVDLPQERLMEAEDIAKVLWNTIQLGPSAVVEEIILRPQLGDL